MAYSTSSPPVLLSQGISNSVPRIWIYSNTDADTTVDDAGYITNAQALGMKVNDLLLYCKTDTPAWYTLIVTAVASTGSTCGTTHTTTS